MGKYSAKFKLEVIQYYLQGHSYRETARNFNLSDMSIPKQWVQKYEMHGTNGLFKNRVKYDGTFKKYVVEYMHVNHLSLTETSNHFNLGHHSVVKKWERIYYEEGPQALYEERRGRNMKNMSSKPKKEKIPKEIEKDLIARIQQLEMENEYLKKLDALVQKRIKQEKKKK